MSPLTQREADERWPYERQHRLISTERQLDEMNRELAGNWMTADDDEGC